MTFNRPRGFRIDGGRPTLRFWLYFGALNGLFFLPLYLLNTETTTFFPPSTIFAEGVWLGLNQVFLWRENLDPFRLSIELTLLVALWVNVPRLRLLAFRLFIILVYLLALGYYLYEAIIISIYHTDPVFFSQYYLALDGLPFLAQHVQTSLWLYVAVIIGALVALLILVSLVNRLLDSGAAPKLARFTRLTMGGLAAIVIFAAFRYQIYTAGAEMVVSSLTFKLQKNVADSFQLRHDIASFDDRTVQQAYRYAQYPLQTKPDIYLIFVESYGSVLYKRADYRRAYTSLLKDLEAQLKQGGWHTTTALSESPTWGGGSWMAYTSTLFGLRIDSHPQYLALMNKYQLETYPDLGRYLKSQGYYYAWVSSISDELDERMWHKYIRFMGVDQWLRFHDLDFHGPMYGWGPTPPDQYTLNAANELLQKQTKQPLLFVTITQNSHYPWVPQPTMVADWHTLNQPSSTQTAPIVPATESATKRQNYLAAVEYQLRMLTDFILHNGQEDSLFILIGDHQPPQVSGRFDGWDTPVHIISKDQMFIDSFARYGFVPGLQVKSLQATLHHEGNYSLFVRALVERYGTDPVALPAYLPQGVVIEQPIKTALK
ncbi:MAG: sulfatase-like hydrolase/transferase [Chloroflexi bacterium]|nr:sulfatase-like hydrolase/transferase [Chloroflexota bacterium]